MELLQLSHRVLAGPRQGAGPQRWTRTIQGAFRSLTPEMSMRTELESFQGSATRQLEDIQERVAALGQYSIYTDGGWEYGGDGMDAPFYRTLTPQAIREEAVLCSLPRTCNGSSLGKG